MKKILTIILAVTMSMVAGAQSATSIVTQQQCLKSLMEKERLGSAIQKMQTGKQTAQNNLIQYQNTPTQKKTYQVAPYAMSASEMDTIELYFKGFYDDPYYTPLDTVVGRQGDTIVTGGDWYFVLQNERYQFIFDVFGASADNPTGTYTEKDLDISYSWCAIPEADGKTSYYKTCNLTIKADKVSENLTKYAIDAVIVTTLGIGGRENGTFKIHAEHESITPINKLDVAILNCEVTPSDDRFRIAGKNDTMEVDMTLFSEFGVVGYYSHKSIDTENTKVVYREKNYEVMEMEGVIYDADMITGGVAYVFMTEVLTTDTSFFNIAMEAPIVPTDTVTLKCKNMMIDASGGSTQATITISASNMGYSILAGFNDTELSAPAIYSGDKAMVYLTDMANDKEISALQCTIEIDGDEENGYLVRIEMLGDDHKYYIMDLAWEVPTPVRTEVLDFKTCSKSMYYVDDLGMEELQLANYNGEYSASFDILYINRVMGGEFTLADLWSEQTFIVHHVGEQENKVPIADVAGSIKQEKGVTYLEATVIGFDSVQYDVSMFYSVPVPTDTITYEFDGFGDDDVVFTNALPQGIFVLEAMSRDGNLIANVQVNRIETETVVGTFYNDGLFTHNDFFTDNTFVKVWNDSIEDYEEFYVQKGELKVTMDEDKVITAVASFICDDAKQYNLTFKVKYERAHLPYDMEEGAVDYTYAPDSRVTIVDYIKDYGLIYFEILPQDYANIAALYFAADSLDPEIGIPAGVYPINYSFEAGTVIESKGIAMDGYPLESYFCTFQIEEDEYGEMALYYNELYCMVEGTVRVEKVYEDKTPMMRLEINAVNSYDRPIHLFYFGAVNALEDVVAGGVDDVKKQLINGQLYIIRNGVTYTVLGNQL